MDVGGNAGVYTTAPYVTSLGTLTPAANRPLNKYALNVAVFQCPADHGDSYDTITAQKSCYVMYGNSYQPFWLDDMYRMSMLPPLTGLARRQSRTVRSAESRLRRLSAVISHVSQSAAESIRAPLGTVTGKRRNNVLFGNGHIAYSKMPDTMPEYLTPALNINGNAYGDWW